jgi:glycolate oxidase FAD binding subunit
MQDAIAHWQEQIAGARDSGHPLLLRGGGSKHFYGQASQGTELPLGSYRGIVNYEPAELVVTARCGTPLATLEAVLAGERQMLPFEPPHFGEATIGGCVAAGLSGPRRMKTGAVRDFVLGARMLDGHGRHLGFGGQVMKNVAGYDVSRLLAGSLGILGIITEVSLKVLPVAQAELTLALELDQEEALAAMRRWGARPLPVTATAWHRGLLHARLSGAAPAVEAGAGKLGGTRMEQAAAAAFWADVREQRHPFFRSHDTPLWRLAVPASAPPGPDGEILIEWGGAQRWLRGDAAAAGIRRWAAANGGHATLFRGGDKCVGVFSALPAPLMALHRNLKEAFDPAGIFNRGRMYREF